MPVPPPPNSDYVPASDADFDMWLQGLVAPYLTSGLLVPDVAALGNASTAFSSALLDSTAGSTRGPSSIMAKDVQRGLSEAIGRLAAQAMVQAYLNGSIPATLLTDGGVRVPSTTSTPRLPPVVGPELVLRGVTPGVISVSVTQGEAGGYRKPIGVVGAEIYGASFTGDPAVPPATLSYVMLGTRKIANIPSGAWFGSQVRLRARWITVRGAVSPFGLFTDTVAG